MDFVTASIEELFAWLDQQPERIDAGSSCGMPDSGMRRIKCVHVIDYLIVIEYVLSLFRLERWYMFPVMFDQFKLVDTGVELAR